MGTCNVHVTNGISIFICVNQKMVCTSNVCVCIAIDIFKIFVFQFGKREYEFTKRKTYAAHLHNTWWYPPGIPGIYCNQSVITNTQMKFISSISVLHDKMTHIYSLHYAFCLFRQYGLILMVTKCHQLSIYLSILCMTRIETYSLDDSTLIMIHSQLLH